MTSKSYWCLRLRALRLTDVAPLLTIAVGMCGVLGWVLGVPFLKSVLPGAVEMKSNTAAALLFAGCALFVFGKRPSPTAQRLAQTIGLAVAGLGFATLLQYGLGWNFRIDELLFRDTDTAYNVFRGRMSPYSAAAFACIGSALALFPQQRMRPLMLVAIAGATTIGVVSLLGHAWNAGGLITDRVLPPVTAVTAFAFIVLSAGTLLTSRAVAQHATRRSRTRASVEAKILSSFIGSLVLLFVAGGITYRINTELADSAQWVNHTQQVRAALGRLYATISDAEAAQRNYLLAGNAQQKREYMRLGSMLGKDEQALADLVVDNPAQLDVLSELRPFIAQRMAALDDHVAIFEKVNLAAAQQAIATDSGIDAKRELQIRVARMDNAEQVLLADREVTLERTRELTLIALLSTLAVATAILIMVYLGLQRQIVARADANRALVDAKEAAVSASRAKSTFLATMSHEIRTPMNGMLGMLELLSLTKLDADQRTTLEIVRQSSKSLLRIIDDILDFSKIEAGKLDIRNEVVSVRAVIEGVHNIYSGNASSKGLLIRRIADPRISPALLVDSMRLRQILNNLVSNALKFTSHGSIEIKAELIERANGQDRIRFSVTDTGIGISPENQGRLFQPFSQTDCDDVRRAGGTGLGLTICRRLAEMMGGSVELVSELGKGTTITVTMSLSIADPKDLPQIALEASRDVLNTRPGVRRVAPSVAQAEAERTLVLLIDDHPTNRMLVCRQVNALGYAAESASDGVEGMQKWMSGRFSIVITDCNMPEMDGYELTRRIRAEEASSGSKRIPVIACTANALAGEAEVCFAAGMDDYLVKPLELPQLLKKLDQWLPVPVPGVVFAEQLAKSQDTGPVDRSVLASISNGDLTTEREILIDFRRTNDEDAAMLERAVASSDIPQVTRASHRILGASRMVGAAGLASVCERIQHASRAHDWASITAGMEAFRCEWIRVNTYFDSI
jgi:signal transduction histidine kinase/CheY-like chemotaxis protein/HPt (histidine-containing phosphotransfer) domain-containing protein